MDQRQLERMRRGRCIVGNIDQLGAIQDATTGDPSTAWQSFAAGVAMWPQNVTGQERYADQQIEGLSRWIVLMRYLRGVTEKMRVTFSNDGATYLLDIEDVEPVDMRNRWLVLRCKSGVNRG